MSQTTDERLATELSLLEAMYPEQIAWDAKARDLSYSLNGRSLQLRLDEGYPAGALPQVLSASIDRSDAREKVKEIVATCVVGEEMLDSIIFAFNELPSEVPAAGEKPGDIPATTGDTTEQHAGKATIVVWLDHLLNTNKRKQALSPASRLVSGVTKPGYPGVLVYSGPAAVVHEHVNELKQLNWQAFQVRYESDVQWTFVHGGGVKEVESMKEVVSALSEDCKDVFMQAMRMK